MNKKITIPTIHHLLSTPMIVTPGITLEDIQMISSGKARRNLETPAIGKFRYICELGEKSPSELLEEIVSQLSPLTMPSPEKILLQGIIRRSTPVHVYK